MTAILKAQWVQDHGIIEVVGIGGLVTFRRGLYDLREQVDGKWALWEVANRDMATRTFEPIGSQVWKITYPSLRAGLVALSVVRDLASYGLVPEL